MAKTKKKSVASQSLRETAKARLAGQKPRQAAKPNPVPPVATDANVVAPLANDANVSTPEAKPGKAAKANPMEKASRKMSALDAAARVLQEMGGAMNCQALIALMAAKGLWTSPGGKTPASTLAAAMQREITTKGDQSRFHKTGRGLFVAAPQSS
jgi:hypothetical protein